MAIETPKYIPSNRSLWQQVTRSSTLVLATLFFVTGALGLPILWSSPCFSTKAKWFWTILVTIYTLILIAATVAIVWWSYAAIMNAFGSD